MEEETHCFFSDLFGKLTTFTNRIDDEGILIQMEIDINEEIGKFGKFRDVPTKREIEKYLPIVFESDTYLYSDIVFLANMVGEYLRKELFYKREISNSLEKLNKILSKKEELMEIIVINLVESSRK